MESLVAIHKPSSTQRTQAPHGRSVKADFLVAVFPARICSMQRLDSSQGKIRSFSRWLALLPTAARVGLFRHSILIRTKAAALMYSSSIKPPALFQELYLMAAAPSRERLTAG